MLALERWGEGRFKPMVMLAHVVALSATTCHELILQTRGKPVQPVEEAESFAINDWLRLYRRPLWLEGVMANVLLFPENVQEVEQEKKRGH